MVFSYRNSQLYIQSPISVERSMFVSRKKEKETRLSRGCSCRLCDVFFFFSPVFFTTKVNVTNGQRSIGRNDPVLFETRFFRERQKSGGWRNWDRVVEGGNVRREWIEEDTKKKWYGESCYQTRRRSNEF